MVVNTAENHGQVSGGDPRKHIKPKNPTEYVVLGALMSGPRHGYEIMQFLGTALDATWRISTSQLYVLLKRLEQEALLESRRESQASRPSKRVVELTGAGTNIFLDWVSAPVEHVRDFRMEFLCKMFFFDHLSMPGAEDLVEKQILVFEGLLEKIRNSRNKNDDGFIKLVYGFKIRNIECLVSWLVQEARPYVERKKVERKRTSKR
jgi:DNA-binding PadR family transcriptional regulator